MARVCLVGADDVELRYELLSRETAREALATYNLTEPYENTVAAETVSLGSAVALLNDLNWYLVRFAESALVLEPSVSDTEWLSRTVAAGIRDDDISPAETGQLLKLYAVVDGTLCDPRYVRRDATDGDAPTHKREAEDADGTVVIRVAESEFEG